MSLAEEFAAAYREQEAGRWDAARTLYLRLLEGGADYPEVRYNLGIVCRKSGRLPEAVDAYRRALELRPEFPEAENNLGNLLRLLWRLDEAAASFRRAVALRPGYAEAWNNLGATLKNLGLIDEAIPCLERAVELRPDNAAFHSNYLNALQFQPGRDRSALFREQLRWGERHGARSAGSVPTHDNDRSPDRRLRVGYVSPVFCEHCQSFFTVPLFSHHDRSSVEIFGYSDAASPDGVTERLRGLADCWRPTSGLSDEDLALRIRADRIDILVDLMLHLAPNQLAVFARRPAPVQVSWLGYPGGTGLSAIGWRLTDPWLDPPDLPADSVERPVRLPDTFWCYDPLTEVPVGELPSLRTGRVTFGCLNNFSKVNGSVLDLWSRVLRALPECRLVLLAPSGESRVRVLRNLGVEPERIDFVDFQPRERYLRTYDRIDLCLDTFPYNGHTTSLDATWMGVPVVTLAGGTAVSRAGLSQASNLGLPEMVCLSPDAFVSRAVSLASDLPALARLRAGLRSRMASSPLMDGGRFSRAVEDAYRAMWRAWALSG
jgi:predicted O-linked N-acetylglucosamine transferase (SPINDLY family)